MLIMTSFFLCRIEVSEPSEFWPSFQGKRYSGSLTQTLWDSIIPDAKVEVFPQSETVMYPV
jgi:hypothetical protein